jgi:hypothetical protein
LAEKRGKERKNKHDPRWKREENSGNERKTTTQNPQLLEKIIVFVPKTFKKS